jgi:hypothetical protein
VFCYVNFFGDKMYTFRTDKINTLSSVELDSYDCVRPISAIVVGVRQVTGKHIIVSVTD